MDQTIALNYSNHKFRRIDEKFSYLSHTLLSEEETQVALQVIHGNSDVGLDTSAREEHLKVKDRLQDNDDQQRLIENEILIRLYNDHSLEVQEVDLANRKISHHNTPTLIESLSSFKNLQLLDLSCNRLGDCGIRLLASNKNKHLALLEQLSIAENQFGSEGSKSLSLNTIWENLKVLNLSGNSIGNEGIKFIAQNPAWTALRVLALNHIGLDQNGAKDLAVNESWEKLEELYLDGNFGLGDQGLLALVYNKTWIHLKKLSICDSGVSSFALVNLKRNKNWKNFKTISLKDQNEYDTKTLSEMDSLCLSKIIRRGGGGVKKAPSTAKVPSELISKLNQYKESVKNNKTLDRDLNLYIETRARDNLLEDLDEKDIQSFELDFKIKKHFLDVDNAAKVLLITGVAGSGKSLFCRHFQRSVLSFWNPEEKQEFESKEWWLPIYVDFSKLENAKTSAVSEALTRELQLTESEIKIFQDTETSNTLPRLLFILDGYDAIQDAREHQGDQNSIQNNFYALNKFGKDWPNAKVIITCREENLNAIHQRELVFAPIDEKSGVVIPGAYLEYTIESFSDIEITAYLRRYVIDQFPTRNHDDDINISSSTHLDGLTTGTLSSWGLVDAYEKFMDLHFSRDKLRNPFLLSIAVDTLRDITEQGYDKVSYIKQTKPVKDDSTAETTKKESHLGRWFYYEAHVNRLLASAAATSEGKEIQSEEMLQQRLQYHALTLSKFTVVDSKEAEKKKEVTTKLDEMLITCSLITKTLDSVGFKFIHRSIQEFLIAQAIVNEIITHLSYPQNMILNQRFLEPHSQVMLFIVDAYKSSKIDAQVLLNLVKMTREKKLPNNGVHKEEETKGVLNETNNNKHPLSNAAANAMSILNIAKFDFAKQDLSDVSIPGAYLSYGKFEGTDFSGANLTGVNFTKAWLKETNFTRANLTDVEFGVLPDVALDSRVTCLEFSQNGQKLAAVLGREVAIFEKGAGGLFYKEIRRLRGHGANIESLSFSSNGKKLVTAGKDKAIYLWDLTTGEASTDLTARPGSNKHCKFSPEDSKIAAALTDQTIVLWDAATSELLFRIRNTSKTQLVCEFSPEGRQILYIDGSDQFGNILDTKTGHYLKKFQFMYQKPLPSAYGRGANRRKEDIQTLEVVKFAGNGQLVAARTLSPRIIFYSDAIRGSQLKCFPGEAGPFHPGGTQTILLTDHDVLLQDTATGKSQTIVHREAGRAAEMKSTFFHSFWDAGNNYAISGDKRIIAKLVERKRNISFVDIPSANQRKSDLIGGDNKSGLELSGARIESAIGFRKERLPLFIHYGDYREFTADDIQKLILGSSDHTTVKEVNLTDRNLNPKCGIVLGRNTTWVNLEKLELSGNSIRFSGAVGLAKSTSWIHLKRLNLADNDIQTSGLEAIASNTTWTELEELILSANSLDPTAGEVLGSNTTWKKLKKLDLTNNALKDEGVSSLAKNSTWTALEELNLAVTQCKDKGIAALRANTVWTNLKSLDLTSCRLSEVGMAELAKNTTWKNLESLIVESNGYSKKDQAAVELAKNTTWEKLKVLNYGCNSLFARGAAEIAKNATWKNLRSVTITDTEPGEEGIKALSLNTWNDLETANLSSLVMGDKGFEHLATNAKWSNLTTLNLSKNKLTHIGMESIAKHNCWSKLETLDLSGNAIGDKGAVSLGKNKHWKGLKVLNLSENKIGAEGIKGLAPKNPWIDLEELNLSQNKINAAGAQVLSENTTWTKLRDLNLSYNAIGNAGIAALGKNKSWTNLQSLLLEKANAFDKGIEDFSKNASWKKLEVLVLNSNSIGPAGVEFLSKNQSWTNLRKLHLNSNKVADAGAVNLSNNESWVNLEELLLYDNSITGEGEEALRNNAAWVKMPDIRVEKQRMF